MESPRSRTFAFAVVAAAFACSSLGATAASADEAETLRSLKKLSLEQLFDVEVTSVSQKPESLFKAAAAVHVVTQDDLRRTGALSIPEALRNIPGVEVARVNSRDYAITARGFNGTAANKLLVLIDGRSVYTPLYSGVFWDTQDAFMEDIQQIEVNRGPGATVWGANAVNGVINVISKKASETQGLLVSGGYGDIEQGFGGARYGGTLGARASYRVYAKHFHRDGSDLPNGAEADDAFEMSQGGFRIDWSPAASDEVTIQGDAFGGHEHAANSNPFDLGGGNTILRWTRRFGASSDLQLQAYYDRTDRDESPVFAERLDTYDAELRHRFAPAKHHDMMWGLAFRRTHDDVHGSPVLAFLPARVSHDLSSAFVQDEWAIFKHQARLTLGSKFEHNDYTGMEIQPSARLSWSPTSAHTVWGAVSRAVRAPSRVDRDLYSPATPPFLLAGGPNFESEVLTAFELGYKVQPASTLTGSIATFYNRYDDLRSIEGTAPPFVFGNGLKGIGDGVETEASWQPSPPWRIDTGYTFLHLDLKPKPGSTDVTQAAQEGDSPRHQAFLRPSWTVARVWSIDVTARYVSELPTVNVPAYAAADFHIGWQPKPAVDLGLYAQDLFDARHVEFQASTGRREIPRSVFGKVTCRF
jgi:iron complex outermembrane receptor protein